MSSNRSSRGSSSGWTAGFFDGLGLTVVRDPERDRTAGLEADWIVRTLGLSPGDRLLDVPCGTGRIAVALAASGIRVTAVDTSRELLQEGRRRATGARPPPAFLEGDMREAAPTDRFDAAINWWGSFGYFSDEENRQVLQMLCDALRPGGRLLVDCVNREHVRRYALGRHDISWEDVRILHEVGWDERSERLEGSWKIRTTGAHETLHSSIRLYTPSQMERLARACGLTETRFFGDWTGRAYSRGSHRMVLSARRPVRE